MSNREDLREQTNDKGKTLPIAAKPPGQEMRRTKSSITVEFHTADGTESRVMKDNDTIFVGRTNQPEGRSITITDPYLSSRHAQFTRKNGVLYVSDLGSSNGTWVSGQKISAPTPLIPGCEVQLGGVTAMASLGSANEAHIIPHLRFFAEVRRAIKQSASPNKTPFAILMIRSKTQPDALCFLSNLSQYLRPEDYVALRSNDTVEVLLPDTDADETTRLAKKLKLNCSVDPQGNPLQLLIGGTVIDGNEYKPRRDSEMDGEIATLLKKTVERIPERDQDAPKIQSFAEVLVQFHGGAKESNLVLHSSLLAEWPNLDQIARSSLPILLEGETGVGKTKLAAHLHERSGLKAKMVNMSCAEISANLIESELFGHKKGSFTGATEDKKGLFQKADGGTIFLDEIAELPLVMQAKLLKVVEEGALRRVGETEPIKINVRVIAATNQNLAEMVREGRFRQDLYQRLKGWVLVIPPLRERSKEAIEEMAQALLERAKMDAAAKTIRTHAHGFSMAALELFRRYSWPGNIREMHMAISKAVSISERSVLEPSDFAELIQRPPAALNQGDTPITPAIPSARPVGGMAVEAISPLQQARNQAERERLLDAFVQNEGRRDKTAQSLGIPLRTLYYRMKMLDIRRKHIDERLLAPSKSPGEPLKPESE